MKITNRLVNGALPESKGKKKKKYWCSRFTLQAIK